MKSPCPLISLPQCTWGFLMIRGTILGVPIIRIIVYWGLYWGTLILGNYHISIRVLEAKPSTSTKRIPPQPILKPAWVSSVCNHACLQTLNPEARNIKQLASPSKQKYINKHTHTRTHTHTQKKKKSPESHSKTHTTPYSRQHSSVKGKL